ncbi:MAG: glycosyltransferase family 2 protein [Candidatus Omnitrophica bacterium]|nr:glycosyltransferase family 2 protein [Candidatus Omnitrophota bacterium]
MKKTSMFEIIIVTYNALSKLKRCLESVQKYTKDFDYLLTIVDNHSTDGTKEYLERLKKIKKVQIIRKEQNIGFCKAANSVLKKSRAKFIVLLDDDVEVTREWLKKMYEQIKSNQRVGIVGCKVVLPDNRINSAEFRINTVELVGVGEIDRGQRNYIRECDSLIGPCWLLRRDVVKKVGYFDERFFPCEFEDVDYCLRVRLAGYKIVYCGEVKIVHHHLLRRIKTKYMFNNKKMFFKKWKNLLSNFPLKDSHQVDKHISNALCLMKHNEFRRSLVELKKAEKIDKRFQEPLYKGIVFEGLKLDTHAIREFRKAVKLNPGNFLALLRLAFLYRKKRCFKDAKVFSKQSLDLIPNDQSSLAHFINESRLVSRVCNTHLC